MKKTVAIAISGGVDSSVAAALLMKQGYDVFGITMRHYQNQAYGFLPDEGIDASIKDAEAVCNTLGIKHYVTDVSNDFKAIVEHNFIEEYRRGRTPNPCTLCNPTIKWGSLLDAAIEFGADLIATGHYIRCEEIAGIFRLFAANDKAKDQSYMLWGLNQHQLSKTLFPLAEYNKDQIRQIARELELPIHDKGDSPEVCFIKGHYEHYIKKHIDLKPGNIILPDGQIIGKHRGLHLYTIGQRKGLNTPWSSPLYVLKLDTKNNVLIVTEKPVDLERTRFSVSSINWISGSKPADSSKLMVQIRYNSRPAEVSNLEIEEHRATVTLAKPVRAITPGQSAVFYHEDEMIGGGIIE